MSSSSRIPEARIVRRLRQFYESQGYFTAKELDLGYGRADLVAFSIDFNKVKSRLDNGQLRSLSRVEHYSIIRSLPELDSGATVPLQHIVESTPLSKEYVRREILPFLIRFGYVKETVSGEFAKVNGFVPIADEILAVEAKVSDWRKGAIQAKRYQVFANRTYLAVAGRYQHRVDRSLLREHRIGLMSVDEQGVYELIPAPSLEPRDQDRFNLATEWLWRYRRRELRGRVQSEFE